MSIVPIDYIKKNPIIESPIDCPPGYHRYLFGTTEVRPGWESYLHIFQREWEIQTQPGTIVEAEIGSVICRLPRIDQFMVNLYKLMVPNGILRINAPHYRSDAFASDIRNLLPICEDSFRYFWQPWCDRNGIQPYTTECDWAPVSCVYTYFPEYETRSESSQIWCRQHEWNVVKSLTLTLRAEEQGLR